MASTGNNGTRVRAMLRESPNIPAIRGGYIPR